MFSRDTRISISGIQFGGDVSKLTAVFGNSSNDRAGFVQCSLGDFTKCAEVISKALNYASDTTAGFPSQIAPEAKPGAAPLEYHTSRYEAAGIYPNHYPYLNAINSEARVTLHNMFEHQFAMLVLADRLLEYGSSATNSKIQKQRTAISNNVHNISEAAEVCYNRPVNCTSSVDSIKFEPVDESALVLPPGPRASFRIMTADRGIWSRDESIKFFKGAADFERPLDEASPQTSASIVLHVTGPALREAALWFENKKLSTIPLHSSAFSEKIGNGYAVIVLATTRANPGWQDVNLDTEREKLQKKENMTSADGIFYITVTDGFGRETRFDIEYEKWSVTDTKNGTDIDHVEHRVQRERWWVTDYDTPAGLSLMSGWHPEVSYEQTIAWTQHQDGSITQIFAPGGVQFKQIFCLGRC